MSRGINCVRCHLPSRVIWNDTVVPDNCVPDSCLLLSPCLSTSPPGVPNMPLVTVDHMKKCHAAMVVTVDNNNNNKCETVQTHGGEWSDAR